MTEAESDDPFRWLEEVEGERALAWVRAETARSVAALEADPRHAGLAAAALAIVRDKDRLDFGRLAELAALEQHVGQQVVGLGAVRLVREGAQQFPVPVRGLLVIRRFPAGLGQRVLVIGAGYTGLHAALVTARAGRSTLVLDAEQPGFGCSTRNGGGGAGLALVLLSLLARRTRRRPSSPSPS